MIRIEATGVDEVCLHAPCGPGQVGGLAAHLARLVGMEREEEVLEERREPSADAGGALVCVGVALLEREDHRDALAWDVAPPTPWRTRSA